MHKSCVWFVEYIFQLNERYNMSWYRRVCIKISRDSDQSFDFLISNIYETASFNKKFEIYNEFGSDDVNVC
jgi:hypothetical protein